MTDTHSESTTIEPPLSQQLTRVDAPMERKRVGDMSVDRFAGLTFAEYRECVEFAKLMSQAKHSVPGYLKNNPGDCLAIVTQSLRWRLEPYWVAQHSYVVKEDSIIAYDSAVHAAIVLSSGVLKGRPEYIWEGEGDARQCTVTCMMRDGNQVLSYTTPPIGKIIAALPNRRDGQGKGGSPLWVNDPDQQQGYFAIRNWGRRHTPELLGGVYDREEFKETTQESTDVTPPSPNLMSRLPAKIEGAGAGFQEDVVDAGLAKEAEQLAEDAKKARGGAQKPQDKPVETKLGQPPKEPKLTAPEPPKTSGAYMAYAADWIGKTDEDRLQSRWDRERDMRDDLKVPIASRKRLEGMMQERIVALRKEAKKKR